MEFGFDCLSRLVAPRVSYFVQAEGHKQGPNLSGLYGRTSGTTAGFVYSEANKKSGTPVRSFNRIDIYTFVSLSYFFHYFCL
jgi:hypothetical protein